MLLAILRLWNIEKAAELYEKLRKCTEGSKVGNREN
jgi:hypothetical protein